MSDILPNPLPPGYGDYIFIFGRGAGLPASTERLIWDGAGDGAYNGCLAGEELVSIVSTSDEDKVGGGGATDVLITYQGLDGLEKQLLVTLNGLTPVNIPVVLMQVAYTMHVAKTEDVSNKAPNHGIITLYQTAVTANILLRINVNEGEALSCFYRVPSDKVFEVWQIDAFPQGNKPCVVRLRIKLGRDFPCRTQAIADAYETPVPIRAKYPITAPAGTYLFISAVCEQAATNVSAMMFGRLRDYDRSLYE